MPMLISVHVPKCAGTSFRHVLQGLYADRLWLNYGAIFTRSQARGDLVPAGAQCIHGHFFADAFDDLFPTRELISWVRDPVQRVVSNYHHFLRSPDMRDDCCRALYERKLSLMDFAQLDWMRNETSRYFAGKSLDQFRFVGVAERFSESLHVFGELFGWPSGLPAPRENVNPARTAPDYRLSRRDYTQLLELNATDAALYVAAEARLDRQLHLPAKNTRHRGPAAFRGALGEMMSAIRPAPMRTARTATI
jgi:hypothetical protein